ncbi:MAG TPA: hypothetical protein VN381_00335 [Anaerovoracaceae bacterium]|nr:hypothetical protein [Anaerovoracaceae bacterium]
MKPLITIESVPISIEYVEKEPRRSSRVSSGQTAQLRISQQTNRVSIQSNPISISLKDTFEQSSVADWSNLSYTATAQYSNDGKLSLNVQFGSNDPADYQFQQFHRGIDHIIDSMPKSSDSAFRFESMQINFDISNLPAGMPPIENLDTDFLPPDLELKVVEWPKVIVKYVGGPIYIPPSADPNYIPPEYQEQVFDGKTNLDLKA